MAAKNQRSATLPASLRHSVQQNDENEGFFAKLKKKLRLKKGKYHVDVNTGECANVSAVSFKKRESREVSEDESPWKLRDPKFEQKDFKSCSPKSTKQSFSKQQTDKHVLTVKGSERKYSNPENYTRSLQNSGNSEFNSFQRSSFGGRSNLKSKLTNEYSPLTYDTKDNVTDRSLKLGESALSNECLVCDSRAIDQENDNQMDDKHDTVIVSNEDSNIALGFDPGYEKLPERRTSNNKVDIDSVINSDFDPSYESVQEVRVKGKTDNIAGGAGSDFDPSYESVQEVRVKGKTDNIAEGAGSDFDPNYESVDDVKSRVISSHIGGNPGYQSVNDVKREEHEKLADELVRPPITPIMNQWVEKLDDPGYQSVKDVKRDTPDRTIGDFIREPKTYSISQSIESLDEPGYESLNDVKKRISEQYFVDNITSNVGMNDQAGFRLENSQDVSAIDEYNDSVISMVPKSESLTLDDLPRHRSKSGDVTMVTSESNNGLRAFAETAVSLTSFATALTGSGSSKDSGFESKEKSLDLEQEENLYSSVKKPGAREADNHYSVVNKGRSQIGPAQQAGTETVHCQKTSGTDSKTEADAYDSETELMLDPGYAECADAIKGFIPFSLYSEDSSSKMSSCTSLDLSAEDFVLEPGYAECADAIKSGAIKKISVSHERLLDHATGGRNDELRVKGDISTEIYANPQILFRKRSKLIEDNNIVEISEHVKTEQNTDKTCPPEPEICLAVENKNKKKENKNKKTKEKELPLEAPPLPARNYSLYLDNEEAAEVVQEVLHDCGNDENADGFNVDDAFEIEISHLSVSDCVAEMSGRETNIDAVFEETEKRKTIAIEKLTDVDITTPVSDNVDKQIKVTELHQGKTDGTREVSISNASNISCVESIIEVSEKTRSGLKECHQVGLSANKTTPNQFEEVKTEGFEKSEEPCKQFHVSEVTPLIATKKEVDFSTCMERDENCCPKGVEMSDKERDLIMSVDDTSTQSNEDCLHVRVQDESGQSKILKVVEKQESFKIQKKRANSRKQPQSSGETCTLTTECMNRCDQVSNECDKPATTKDSKVSNSNEPETETNIALAQTKDLIEKSNMISQASTNIPDTNDNELIGNVEETGPRGTDNLKNVEVGNIEPIFFLQPSDLSQVVDGDMVRNRDINSVVSTDTYQPQTSNYIQGLSGADSSNFLTVAVKMKTISLDSDIDLFNTEDLPKLEINESDLESAFDSSDNSNNLDIETESADIDKLTKRLNEEDGQDMCSKQCKCREDKERLDSENSCPKCKTGNTSEGNDIEMKIISQCDNEIPKDDTKTEPEPSQNNNLRSQSSGTSIPTNEIELKTVFAKPIMVDIEPVIHVSNDVVFGNGCEEDNNNRNATLESKLCVVDSENKGESYMVNFLDEYHSASMAGADLYIVEHELSDDSAIGNNDDLHQNYTDSHQNSDQFHESNVYVGETFYATDQELADKANVNEVDVSNCMTSQELHLIYEKKNPCLYEDTEPTHMSLSEAMGWSVDTLNVQVEHSHSNNSSSRVPVHPNTCVHSNIPDVNSTPESAITPPPRPPYLAGQSKNRVSFSHQSNRDKAVTPVDEVPPPFRLTDSSGQSDEEGPPAVPPRDRPVRTLKRPGYSHDFMESMRQLKDCGWYWGPLSWQEAEHKLAKKPEGTFLVRDSSDEHYILSLSFKHQGGVHHTRIEHHKGHFSFWSQPESHGKSTIKDFIEQCVEHSRNGRFLYFIRPSGPGSPPMPIQLLNPVSRFIQMRSLQHMCRFRILQLVRRDHIDHLPIPTRIKQYLKEAQYYVEYLDD